MATNKHIERIGDTEANIRANLDTLQIAVETDDEQTLVWANNGASRYYYAAAQYYKNAAGAKTFVNVEHNRVTVNENLYVNEYIYRRGDVADRILLQNDKITITAGGNANLIIESDKVTTPVDINITADNEKLTLGADNDMEMYYTGTKGQISTTAVTWSDLHVNCGSQRTIELDVTVWDDLRVPAQNTKLNPAKSEPAFESFRDGLFVYKFDTSNADDESVHFVAQMPHNYKEGTDLEPHIHWSPDNTDTGNVFWSFEYSVANIDGTFGASTTDDILVAADGTQYKHQVDFFSDISGVGLTISHILICRLTRKSTTEASDTFTGNAGFLEFDFHHEINTMGSRNRLVK